MIRGFVFSFSALLFCAHAQAQAQPLIGPYFNQQVEFPNHFLSKKGDLAESRELLEKAMKSLCERLVVPLQLPGDTGIKKIKYFDYMTKLARQLDPQAQIMPSGGVVRSMLSYLYDQMHSSYILNPEKDPLDVLRKIIQETAPVEAMDIRGVGGDFDVLVKSNPQSFTEIQKKVEDLTNSVETKLKARKDQSKVKRLLFTVGDVKEYSEQTQRSTQQGGSVIDFLAFDPAQSKFIEPEGHEYIVDEFLQGKFRYIAPSLNQKPENFNKQVIRGIRPFIELPFLSLKEEAQFKTELLQVTEQLKKGRDLGDKALSQIGKAVRNGRWSLGNNRIVRGAPSSIESNIRALSVELHKKDLPYIPEFVDTSPLELRHVVNKQELRGFPKELLTSVEKYIEISQGDYLIHGTPKLDFAMSILRGGLFYSGGFYEQGKFVMGDGGNSATVNKTNLAKNGIQLKLKLKKDERMNILVWNSKTEKHPFMVQAKLEAEKLSMPFFQYLQRYHGIDLVDNAGVGLIQNMTIIVEGSVKERLENFLNGYVQIIRGSSVSSSSAALLDKFKALDEYSRLSFNSKELDLKVEPLNSDDFKSILTEFTAHTQGQQVEQSFVSKLAALNFDEILENESLPELKEKYVNAVLGLSPVSNKEKSIFGFTDFTWIKKLEEWSKINPTYFSKIEDYFLLRLRESAGVVGAPQIDVIIRRYGSTLFQFPRVKKYFLSQITSENIQVDEALNTYHKYTLTDDAAEAENLNKLSAQLRAKLEEPLDKPLSYKKLMKALSESKNEDVLDLLNKYFDKSIELYKKTGDMGDAVKCLDFSQVAVLDLVPAEVLPKLVGIINPEKLQVADLLSYLILAKKVDQKKIPVLEELIKGKISEQIKKKYSEYLGLALFAHSEVFKQDEQLKSIYENTVIQFLNGIEDAQALERIFKDDEEMYKFRKFPKIKTYMLGKIKENKKIRLGLLLDLDMNPELISKLKDEVENTFQFTKEHALDFEKIMSDIFIHKKTLIDADTDALLVEKMIGSSFFDSKFKSFFKKNPEVKLHWMNISCRKKYSTLWKNLNPAQPQFLPEFTPTPH